MIAAALGLVCERTAFVEHELKPAVEPKERQCTSTTTVLYSVVLQAQLDLEAKAGPQMSFSGVISENGGHLRGDFMERVPRK